MAKSMNDLKKEIEGQGHKWADALKIIKDHTGKNVKGAMDEGWTVEEIESLLVHELNKPEDEPKESGQLPEKQVQPETEVFPSHLEAPASLNTYYISPGGFRWQFTIRPGLGAKEMTTLLEQAAKAETWLKKKGYAPYVPFKDNSNAHAPQAGGDGNGNGKSKYCNYKSDEPGFCPTHGKELKKSQHHPGYYCPARV